MSYTPKEQDSAMIYSPFILPTPTRRERFVRFVRTLQYKLYIRWLAFQWMKQLNVGDRVIYQGKEWTISNGVCGWHIVRGKHVDGTFEDVDCVKTEELKKVKNFSNYYGSYKSGVYFYETSWLSIWVDRGIEPWIRALRIWPRKED